jgi:hypothetical protein
VTTINFHFVIEGFCKTSGRSKLQQPPFLVDLDPQGARNRRNWGAAPANCDKNRLLTQWWAAMFVAKKLDKA